MERIARDYLLISPEFGLRQLGAERGPVRIIFFPFLGGQSLSFKKLARTLPETWELWAPDPPGHGRALGEMLTHFDDLVDLYRRRLSFLFEGNFYFYGHSMGGLVAYEIARLLEQEGNAPKKLMMGASPVPHKICNYRELRRKDRKQLIENIIACGGIPEPILKRKSFLLRYMPAIKADIEVFLSAEIPHRPISIPITVFYSQDDIFCSHETMCQWGDYSNDVSLEKIEGNHIFIHSHYREVGEKILEIIQ